jgi:hypothetical protein
MTLADCEGRATDGSAENQMLGIHPARGMPGALGSAACALPRLRGRREDYPPPMEATSRRVSAR